MSVYIKEKPEYLDRALKSILIDQTLKPAEVVIVEDGPISEELKKIIEKYKKDFTEIIKSIKIKENKGLGDALNIGLKKSSYDIVARMDTDDIALPNRFEKQFNFFIKNDFDVVGTNIIEFENNENNIIGYKNVPETHNEIVKYSKKRNPINHPSVMFKKESVLKSGNYEKMLGFEDYYLWVRMIMKGYKFYNIQEPLLKFRTGKEMIKRRGSLKYFKNEKNFFKNLSKIGYLNYFEYLKTIIMRFFFRIFPDNMRLIFYNKILRTKK
ncbi:glycosyltransferase [Geotoga petraea]|uniref:Glycosyltransferase n=1 Tax=Geotoga petraea TaxID=28234 RepID=A0A4Z0VVN1_9BACT|nr:glycosyltransferase [Geotoga petraea]TGG88018.1 glycosyltransferase [Geotoga petraea]